MPADRLKTVELTPQAREFMFAFPRRHPGLSAVHVLNGLQVVVLAKHVAPLNGRGGKLGRSQRLGGWFRHLLQVMFVMCALKAIQGC